MKVNMVKNVGGLFSPADEEAENQLRKVKNCDTYTVDIKLNQNYRLHKKMFAFFTYCARYYYGNDKVTNDEVEFTRGKLVMAAGYYKQVFYPDGIRFELKPLSLKYEEMPPEERSECYKKIIDAALKNVFHSADESIYNKLMSYF